jgi:hypothetical protein
MKNNDKQGWFDGKLLNLTFLILKLFKLNKTKPRLKLKLKD